MTPIRQATLLALAIATMPGSTGCRGCDEDKPYTPFGVASLPSADAKLPLAKPLGSPAASAAPTGFMPKTAQRAPAGATTWQLGGQTFTAPAGSTIELGLLAELDDREGEDAILWVRSGKEKGELWFYPGGAAPRRVAQMPTFVPTGPGCTLATGLSQTGPRTVALDVAAACESSRIARTPVRSLQVLAPARPQPQLVALQLAEPARGELFEVAVDSTDRDRDEQDDVTVQVSLRREPGERGPSVRLAWLDRAAGASRDPSLPAASFASIGSTEVVRARGKKTALQVMERLAVAQRLLATVCAEGATPRIFDGEGSPLSCGDLGPFVNRAAEAQVRAALAQGRLIEAFGVLDKDGWLVQSISVPQRAALETLLRKAVTLVEPSSVRVLAATVPSRTARPRWSPLQFEQPGESLLIQSSEGLLRTSADGQELETPSPDSGLAPWPLEVQAPDGTRWIGARQACDRSEMLLAFVSGTGELQVPAPELLASRPGICAGKGLSHEPLIVPLGYREGQLGAIVAGSRVGPDAVTSNLGGPRSPDGRHLVVPTSLGVLVLGPAQPELWNAATLPQFPRLGDCVVANDARAIACVDGNRVVLARR